MAALVAVDLLIAHSVVANIDAERRVLGDGAVVVDEGRVAEAGSPPTLLRATPRRG